MYTKLRTLTLLDRSFSHRNPGDQYFFIKKYCWNLRNSEFVLVMLELLFPGEIGQTSKNTLVIMVSLGVPAPLLNFSSARLKKNIFRSP